MLYKFLVHLTLLSFAFVSPSAWAAPGTSTDTSQSTKRERNKDKKKRKSKRSKKGKKKKKGKVKKAVRKAAKKVKEAGKKATAGIGKGAKKVKGTVSSALSYDMLLGRGKDSAKVVKCLQGVKSLPDLAEETRALVIQPGRAVTSKFNEVWGASEQAIKTHVSRMKVPKNIKDMPRFAWELQLKITNDAGKKSKDIKIMACILKGLDRKFKKIEPRLQKVMRTLQSNIKQRWENELAPRVSRKLTDLMIGQLQKGKGGKRVKDTAMRVTGRILLAAGKVQSLEKKLKTYEKALASGNASKVQSTFRDVKRSLKDTPEPARVLVLVAEELIQEEVEKVIDQKFSPVVEKAVATLSSGVAVLNGVIDGACGIIPAAGAAVCTAFITRSIRLSYDWVVARYIRDQIIAKAKELSHRLVKYAGSLAYEVAGQKVDREYAQIRQRYSKQFGAAKKVIKPFITTLKRDVFPAVQAVHSQRAQLVSVLEQANVAASRP